MAEEKVFFRSGGLRIEGLLEKRVGENGVVVTHPHPLYGGEMHNHVVEAVVEAYQDMGYTTLRFNFRGVGHSEGRHDNGEGEQEDVKAALEYVSALGKTRIDLAGYSFGAWVNARGLTGYSQVGRMIMVSPPLNFIDFQFLKRSPKIQLVIVGSHDEIAGPEKIREKLSSWNPDAAFHILEGADHFYSGRTEDLKSIIGGFLAG